MISAVYDDQTAETTSDDALARLVVVRKSIMLAYREAAQAIRGVLADPNDQHPTGPALKQIREAIAQAKDQEWREGAHANRGFLEDVEKELANAPTLAIEQKVSEREIVQSMLADKQRKADLYAAYATVRKTQPQSDHPPLASANSRKH